MKRRAFLASVAAMRAGRDNPLAWTPEQLRASIARSWPEVADAPLDTVRWKVPGKWNRGCFAGGRHYIPAVPGKPAFEAWSRNVQPQEPTA